MARPSFKPIFARIHESFATSKEIMRPRHIPPAMRSSNYVIEIPTPKYDPVTGICLDDQHVDVVLMEGRPLYTEEYVERLSKAFEESQFYLEKFSERINSALDENRELKRLCKQLAKDGGERLVRQALLRKKRLINADIRISKGEEVKFTKQFVKDILADDTPLFDSEYTAQLLSNYKTLFTKDGFKPEEKDV